MSRPPWLTYIITIVAIILALWMTWDALFGRLFNQFAFPNALWIRILDAQGIDALDLAWPILVVGTSWLGALAGLWLKQSWSVRALMILAALSLFYLWGGTLLALIVLIASGMPATREWVKGRHE